jgi:hypothetical protein
MGAAGRLISFTLPYFLDAKPHPLGKFGPSNLQELGRKGPLGWSGLLGRRSRPGLRRPG